MDRSCLQNRLTPQEREQFEQDGYLVVNEALPLLQCDALTQIVDNNSGEESAGRCFVD